MHIISQHGEKHDVVKHEHVGIHQLGCAQLHLHLPTSRVRCHKILEIGCAVKAARIAETSLDHELLALIKTDEAKLIELVTLIVVDVLGIILWEEPKDLPSKEK